MIIANQKPIYIIGYVASSMTHEFVNEISKTHSSEIIEPEDFLKLLNRQQYQYIVASWIDLTLRRQVTDLIDQQNLDLITVISDTAAVGRHPLSDIHPGTFIFDFCRIGLGSSIGKHCIISEYSLVGHYTKIEKGCILRPGVIVVDRSRIGNNCLLNTRSTVVNGAVLCDGVQLMGFSTITKDVVVPGKYAGTPARKIK
jgi:UDP-3-O-[3-hydroxymyristoyl] glucosamine N-acyltransferase